MHIPCACSSPGCVPKISFTPRFATHSEHTTRHTHASSAKTFHVLRIRNQSASASSALLCSLQPYVLHWRLHSHDQLRFSTLPRRAFADFAACNEPAVKTSAVPYPHNSRGVRCGVRPTVPTACGVGSVVAWCAVCCGLTVFSKLSVTVVGQSSRPNSPTYLDTYFRRREGQLEALRTLFRPACCAPRWASVGPSVFGRRCLTLTSYLPDPTSPPSF